MYDILISGGTVIDGTGAPRQQTDVAVKGDSIVAIGELSGQQSKSKIEASGKIVCPGFIDVHNHSDGWLLKESNFHSKTAQGFTTEVLALDGVSYAPVTEENWREWFYYLHCLDGLTFNDYTGWQTLEEFQELFDKTTAQNSAMHIPYGNVRVMVNGFRSRPLDDFQRRVLRAEIENGMETGAVGLSTGIDYVGNCFSSTEELIDACKVVARYGGLHATHVRYKEGLVPALAEMVDISKRSGVKLHVSHMKTNSDEELEILLEYLAKEVEGKIDFSFDLYPYGPGSTMLSYMLPYEVWEEGPMAVVSKLNDPVIRRRFQQSVASSKFNLEKTYIAGLLSDQNQQHLGRSLGEVIRESGKTPADFMCDLLIEERMSVLLVVGDIDVWNVDPLFQHPGFMMGTDGIYNLNGPVHQRQFGSVGLFLSEYVRERKVLSLEQAIQHMSSVPAKRFGLPKRGEIAEGLIADLVVFDPDEIHDPTTIEAPRQNTVGVHEVIVSGESIIRNAEPVSGATPGCAIKSIFE